MKMNFKKNGGGYISGCTIAFGSKEMKDLNLVDEKGNLKEIIKDNWQAKAIELTNLGTIYPAESELNALDVLLLAKTSNPPLGGLLATRDDLSHFIANDSIKDSVTLASLMKIARKSHDFN